MLVSAAVLALKRSVCGVSRLRNTEGVPDGALKHDLDSGPSMLLGPVKSVDCCHPSHRTRIEGPVTTRRPADADFMPKQIE